MRPVARFGKIALSKSTAISYLPQITLLSIALTLLFNVWQVHYGFSLKDEGFLFYGVQQVLKGAVPVRDFMAYDAGRYYAAAALMSFWGGKGLLSLRWAMMIFEMIAVSGGLVIISGSIKHNDLAYFLASALIFLAWMVPYYKMADFAACILLLGGLSYLVRRPTMSGYLVAGICVGFSAVLGRNHGVYGIAGSLGVISWLAIEPRQRPGLIRGCAHWALGVAIGFSPVLLMMALVPGFAAAMWESVLLMFRSGSTNIALPVPWPWHVNFTKSPISVVQEFIIGCLFIGVPAFGLGSIIWVSLRRMRGKPAPPALVAAAFLALPYTHYAYSRADLSHLAFSILPLVMGFLVVTGSASPRVRLPIALAAGLVSLGIAAPFQLAYYCERYSTCVTTTILSNKFTVEPWTAKDLDLLRELAAKYAVGNRPFLAAPFWPGAYAVFQRKSPMWEIYALIHRPTDLQKFEIRCIIAANPSFAVISRAPLDGREDLAFPRTHALVYQYIISHFDSIKGTPYSSLQIFRARPAPTPEQSHSKPEPGACWLR